LNIYIKINGYVKSKKICQRINRRAKKELEQGYLHGEGSLFRKHGQATLLNNQGFSVQELMKIFDCRKNTIYDWFNNWEEKGIEGLKLQAGRGRKATFDTNNIQEVELVKLKINENRKKLSLAKAEIESNLGKKMCEETLRRFLKVLTTVGVDSVRASKTSKTQKKLQRKNQIKGLRKLSTEEMEKVSGGDTCPCVQNAVDFGQELCSMHQLANLS
jgi:transposase